MSRLAFLDLLAATTDAASAVEEALVRVARSGTYLRGRETTGFENAWAKTCEARGAVAVSSGTDALRLALLATGVGAGDEVIVPAFGSPYTALAVLAAGAVPVFADIEATTWTLSPASTRDALGPRTKAIVAVHLYGRRAALSALAEISDTKGLVLIEDAAQAHGLAGAPQGRAQVHSFYPTKNLGALGDAGSVVSNFDDVLERVRTLREGGEPVALDSGIASGVARVDELQAAVLAAKLPFLAAWNARRRSIAERYRSAFAKSSKIVCPAAAPREDHVWHLFVIEHEHRASLIDALSREGIETKIHFPFALHRQSLFRSARTAPSLAHAEHAAERVLSLPLHPGLADAEVDRVIAAVVRHA